MAMNELGEVCIQFHVYSDSHDQMMTALQAFLRMTHNIGLPEVKIFFTVNPAGDKQFYMRMLPSLQVQQDMLNTLGTSAMEISSSNDGTPSLPSYPYEQLLVQRSTMYGDIKHQKYCADTH